MKHVLALQHCESEFLGLVEDHLEGRGIAFAYVRPFAAGTVPGTAAMADGLVLMGGGGWGAAPGARCLPSLEAELRLTRDFLARRKPVLAWGVGAQILALAAGGGVDAAPLCLSLETVRRTDPGALGGFMPERFPMVVLMRDRPRPPADARILAVDGAGQASVYRIGERAIGFTGHPGMKPGMLEDLIMEFDDAVLGPDGAPADIPALLDRVRAAQAGIADALVGLMTGIVHTTGLMQAPSPDEMKRRTIIPIRR